MFTIKYDFIPKMGQIIRKSLLIFTITKSKPIWVRISAKNNENFEIDKKIQKNFKLRI